MSFVRDFVRHFSHLLASYKTLSSTAIIVDIRQKYLEKQGGGYRENSKDAERYRELINDLTMITYIS